MGGVGGASPGDPQSGDQVDSRLVARPVVVNEAVTSRSCSIGDGHGESLSRAAVHRHGRSVPCELASRLENMRQRVGVGGRIGNGTPGGAPTHTVGLPARPGGLVDHIRLYAFSRYLIEHTDGAGVQRQPQPGCAAGNDPHLNTVRQRIGIENHPFRPALELANRRRVYPARRVPVRGDSSQNRDELSPPPLTTSIGLSYSRAGWAGRQQNR